MSQSSFRSAHKALACTFVLSLMLSAACGGEDFTSPGGSAGGTAGAAGDAGNGGVGGSAGGSGGNGGAAGDAGAGNAGAAGDAGNGGAAGDAGAAGDGGAAGDAGAAGSGGAPPIIDCTGIDDGTPCEADGGNTLCVADACVESECGDGYVDESEGEFCDDGKNGDDSDGCKDDCQATCGKDADCDDGNPCNGVETCGGNVCVLGSAVNCDDGNPCTTDSCIMGNGSCGHQNLDDGTACGTGKLCLAESCKSSICGDGWVDAAKNEECDDRKNGNPNDGCTDNCKFSCKGNTDCNDNNACTTDTCNTTTHTCTNTTISCDDTDACTADSCNATAGCVHAFIDQDNDGYSPFTCKVGGTHAGKGGDCADTGTNSAAVHPGVTMWFTTDHGVAGVTPYDYDCSGVADKQYEGNWDGIILTCTSPGPGWDVSATGAILRPYPACGVTDLYRQCGPFEQTVSKTQGCH